MLTVRDLSKSYPPRVVFRSVSFDAEPGEWIAVIGESGSGKSTLLNLLAGLDRPSGGEVALDGVDIAQLGDDAATLLRRRKVGFVFQAFHLLPHLSCAENIALPLALLGVPFGERRARVTAMLLAVGLADRGQDSPRQLSGGEQQRVALARALVHRPRLLLADEPTGNLDAGTAAQVLGLLREQVKDMHTVGILVTHSRQAAAACDPIYELRSDGLAAR